MKIAFLEAPTDIGPEEVAWIDIMDAVQRLQPDALLLNEMPLGPWVAASPTYDTELAQASVSSHDALLAKLTNVQTDILGTRPIIGVDRLRNEGFLLRQGHYKGVHCKAHFPSENGWFEDAWFEEDGLGFVPVVSQDISFGFLICTELMFTEKARLYASRGAHVIVVPRATGGNPNIWKTAASMAAITSGCYVISSNRTGTSREGVKFNGCGFAFSPDGALIEETSPGEPVKVISVDPKWVRRQQASYPCYVTIRG